MGVKIGNSYVSESAVAFAKNNSENKSDSVLADLQKKFKNINFSVGTQPFGGSGKNNISVAPNILREMKNNPEKRIEYEALIYDCENELRESSGRKNLKSQGFIIGSDGGLRKWGISQINDGKKIEKNLMNFTEDERQRLAGRLPTKKKSFGLRMWEA